MQIGGPCCRAQLRSSPAGRRGLTSAPTKTRGPDGCRDNQEGVGRPDPHLAPSRTCWVTPGLGPPSGGLSIHLGSVVAELRGAHGPCQL